MRVSRRETEASFAADSPPDGDPVPGRERVVPFWRRESGGRVTETTKGGPETVSTQSGTEGSNPAPSSEESRANLKTTSTFALRHSIAIRVPKKTPASMITDTGKVAGGKPATGRLCQAGLREKASVRHLARRLTGYRKESSTNSRDNVQGNSSPQRSERRGTERLDYRTSEGRVLATWFRKADRVVARTPVGRDRRNRRASRPPSVGASGRAF